MFEITLITVGKLKEKFYLAAANEYQKRLNGYCSFKIIELPEYRLPENPSAAEISAGLDKEAELILSKITKNTWFCVLTPEGKLLTSELLAEKLAEIKLSGKSSAVFLIGSSFGITGTAIGGAAGGALGAAFGADFAAVLTLPSASTM